MVISVSCASVTGILAGALGFTLLMPGGAASVGSSAAVPVVSLVDLTRAKPLLAEGDDLAPPPSPDAIVTTPPPVPFAENVPPPLPGYAWDPGRWVWDGGQYVWEPGKYIVQPTNGATFTPGYWQQFSRGWALVDGRWSWGSQGVGE